MNESKKSTYSIKLHS